MENMYLTKNPRKIFTKLPMIHFVCLCVWVFFLFLFFWGGGGGGLTSSNIISAISLLRSQ